MALARFGLLCMALLALAVASSGPLQAAVERFRVGQAEFAHHDAAAPPAFAHWQAVSLPDRWPRTRPQAVGPGWYRVAFSLGEAPSQPWMVYLPRMRDGGLIFVNGKLLASVPQRDAEHYVRWVRPHGFTIPPAQLRAGANQVHVRVPGVEDQSMSTLYIGPEPELRALRDRRHLAVYTSAQITVILTFVVAVFVLVIWIRRRMAFEFGLFGLATLFWGLRTVSFVVEVYPLWSWHYVRVMHYAATGGFVVSMTLFMLRFANLRHRALERSMMAYWPSGPLLLLLGGMAWHDAVDRYYQAGLLLMGAVMIAAVFYAGWRQRTLGALALCAGVVAGVTLGVHDYLLSQGWFGYENPYLLHLGADLLIVIVGALLAERFARSLGEVEQANAVLALKVAEKESELAANYEKLRDLERERAVVEERQRIMQDMHDGLGSQLLTSLAAVERGALDAKAMAQVLRDAMDDMRLVIDTLSPGREGLLEALGNLRYRLEPRFRAAGIELGFTFLDLPERLEIDADDALQILRVLQESLTNVLKHARARHVAVSLAYAPQTGRYTLAVADDGAGFDAAASPGRGLSGMRRRARQIGAELAVASDARGTRVALEFPVFSR
jgi:signal transduction histidine kinase